jgi:hypothetical protein
MLGIPTHAANLVIISHKNFLTQAETWANYRRSQGFAVKVIEVSEIFDEFGYGLSTAFSIREFLRYASQNWQTPPSYVLLIGDASFDPRNYQGHGYNNFVPSKIVNTVYMETASDEWLGDFNNDGLSELAIGRIPSRDTASISTVFGKVTNWESSLSNPLSRGALFAYDLPIGYDFEAMSNRLKNQLPAGTSATLISRGQPDASAAVISAMNTGKYLVNYSGHGALGVWGGTNFFTTTMVPQLTNASNQSIFTMLTCLNGYFHQSQYDSLSEALLKSPNGGGVVTWASTGKTTPDVQDVLGQRFYQQIGAGNIPRIGDLVKDAKTAVVGGTDVRLSWVLLGDPMLKVR